MADDGDSIVAFQLFVRRKGSTRSQLNAQNLEEAGRAHTAQYTLGLAATGEIRESMAESCDMLEAVVLLSPIEEIRVRHRSFVGQPVSLPDHHQPVG